jgi:hypothetical protein
LKEVLIDQNTCIRRTLKNPDVEKLAAFQRKVDKNCGFDEFEAKPRDIFFIVCTICGSVLTCTTIILILYIILSSKQEN